MGVAAEYQVHAVRFEEGAEAPAHVDLGLLLVGIVMDALGVGWVMEYHDGPVASICSEVVHQPLAHRRALHRITVGEFESS
jgi:hypothetical protein